MFRMFTTEPPKERSLSVVWQENVKNIRNLISFWLFGLANNFGYVIMLSAAFDILRNIENKCEENKDFKRLCNEMSTGVILLASIVPSFCVKMFVPFLPLWIHARMIIVVITYTAGLLLVAQGSYYVLIIAGVCFVSFASGLGESSLIAYTVFFNTRNVLSTWASGTGAAGLFGSFSYSLMIQLGLTPNLAIISMLVMPLLMAVCYWFILDRPSLERFPRMLKVRDEKGTLINLGNVELQVYKTFTFRNKLNLVPHLLIRFTLFYGLVYFFEYFINQGLFELLQFPNTFLTIPQQYRWYNFMYQLGVFISRSSMNVVSIDYIWLLALLQACNVVIFLCEVTLGIFKYLQIILVLILWEGLLGGAAYVNTFRLIAVEMPDYQREFALSLNAIGDSVMITLAGIMAIPVHNAICHMESPYGPMNTTVQALN